MTYSDVFREAVDELRRQAHLLDHASSRDGKRGCPGQYAGCRKCRLALIADDLERIADEHEKQAA